MALKPIKFRAYADAKRRYWVEVRVFETGHAMRRDIRRCLGKVDPNTDGQVNGATFRRKGRLLGVFAIMWLSRETVTKWPTEIVTHESVHAALRYFERRQWPACLEHESRHGAPDVHERRLEERLAYAAGRIAKYAARGLFRHGVWK